MPPEATNQQSDTAPVIEAIERLTGVERVGLERGDWDGASVMAVPKGKEIKSMKPFLDEYLQAPERLKGTARLTTLDSFIDHVVRCKDEDSVIFADSKQDSASLTAVFNYNQKDRAPRFGDHRAVYSFPLSEEWKAWKAKAAKGFIGQAEFAEFLEDRVGDVVDAGLAGDIAKKFASDLGLKLAGPQRLMELSRGLTVHVNSRIVDSVNLSSGEVQFSYSDEHKGEAGQPLNVPGGFVLALPVFRGGDPFQVPVRLRYRTKDGISWAFLLQRTDAVWDVSIKEACDKAASETGLPLFYGSPEA